MSTRKSYAALCEKIVAQLHVERERQGLSKYALEQKSGVSQQMIGYMERGLRCPSLETALRISDALELDMGKLISKARKAASKSKQPSPG